MRKARRQQNSLASARTNSRDQRATKLGPAICWALATLLGTAVALGIYVSSRSARFTRESPPGHKDDDGGAGLSVPFARFVNVTDRAGIAFRHQNAANGRKLLPETMGGGCAFFDFDNDGDQDLLLVNALRRWPWDRSHDDPPDLTTALYSNDGRGRFSDVTNGSGLDVQMYATGVAAGDYDGDGHVDVLLTAVGQNRLFHNEGGGKFRNVTDEAGVAGDERQWTTSCGWFDYDNDGDLDLFVCNYVEWSREYDEKQGFQLTDGSSAYGRPQSFNGSFPLLYRNDGDGRFSEVAAEAGLHVRDPATGAPIGKSLGVTFVDVDEDDRMDVFVANDTTRNFFFHNLGEGQFEEVAVRCGVAFDANGNTRGAMGIDAAWLNDGNALAVGIGNFANEMSALYVAYDDQMQFVDEATIRGIGPTTQMSLTFGLFFFDYDLDGRDDLFAVNGHLEDDINRVQPSQTYEQSPEFFWNSGERGRAEFVPVAQAHCGPDLLEPLVGRGASYADIDGDGDLDVLITCPGRTPRLLRNDQQLGHHWLRLKLTATGRNPDAIGARVEVELDDGRILKRQVMPTRSYLSQVELPLTYGLGQNDGIRAIRIAWPDGSREGVEIGDVDRTYEIRQQTPLPSAVIGVSAMD